MSAGQTVKVRCATVNDLPAVHQLIRESFAAMAEHSCFGADFWARGADELISKELNATEFENEYFRKGPGTHFWVATSSSEGVVGCIGLKHSSPESNEAELVRMAVSANVRSCGVGSVLMNQLLTHARSTPAISKIHLTTGNPRSAIFYQKHGFVLYDRILFKYMEKLIN